MPGSGGNLCLVILCNLLQAIRILEAAHLKDEAEERLWKTSLKKLYLNLSLCNLRQRKSDLAISNCQRVLELDRKNVKACFRMGQVGRVTHLSCQHTLTSPSLSYPLHSSLPVPCQAHMQLGNFEKSKKFLVRAGKLSPGNEEIRQELKKLDR